jgi:hypothetical protein
MWLIDKFGTTEEVLKKWKKLEERYNEIFNEDEVKSQISTIKEESKSSQ